jgi:hypothetical protein
MNATSPNTLGRALRGFFADHLPRVRGASPHTVRSYRDTFVLLLRFIATRTQRSVPELDVDHLGPEEVLDFLHELEVERHNVAATRNVRLAAIHASFATVRQSTPSGLSTVNVCWPYLSSAPARAPSSTWSSPKSRLCSGRSTARRRAVVATTRSS